MVDLNALLADFDDEEEEGALDLSALLADFDQEAVLGKMGAPADLRNQIGGAVDVAKDTAGDLWDRLGAADEAAAAPKGALGRAIAMLSEPVSGLLDFDPQAFGGETEAQLSSLGGALAQSYMEPIYGGLDMLGVNMDDMGILDKESRAEALATATEAAGGRDFGSTAGAILGGGSQFAIPGAGLSKLQKAGSLLNAAGKMSKARKFNQLLGMDVGLGAGIEALRADEGERLESAAMGAGASLLGGGVGAALGKVRTGADVKKGVQEFLDSGGYMTPGQMAKSINIRGLEAIAGVTPFTARFVKATQKAAEESISPAMTKQVAKALPRSLGKNVTKGGHVGQQQLSAAVKKGYGDAWEAADPKMWTPGQRKVLSKVFRANAKDHFPSGQGIGLNRLATDIGKKGTTVKQVDSQLREMMETTDDYDYLVTLKSIRDRLRKDAGPETAKRLKAMDAQYPKFLTVQRAASKADEAEFIGGGLGQASRFVGGQKRAAEGTAPLLRQADMLKKLTEEKLPEPLEAFRRLARFAPTFMTKGTAQSVGNRMMGRTEGQAAFRKAVEDNPYLLEIMTRIGAGGASGLMGDEDTQSDQELLEMVQALRGVQ